LAIDVRFGSKADIAPWNLDVRYSPQLKNFVIKDAKRLLQHYLPEADIGPFVALPAQLGFALGIGEGSKHGRFGFGVNRSTDLFYPAVEEKIIRYE
jgi:hypothetical protein